MAGTREAAVTKRAKILIATMAAALTVGGLAPMAHAQQRRSVGQVAYQQLTNVTDGDAGRIALRVVQAAVDAAF
jgi:hypothetical protein